MTDQSDEQLAVRIQQGDVSASTEFYDRHKQSVFQYCVRLLRDVEAAKDAFQNSFLRFFESIRTLKEPVTVRAWLYAIVRNEVYSQLRRRRSNGSIDDIEVRDDETPHVTFVREEDAKLVQRLLTELRPEYHEVLYLLEYEKMTYAEIAEVTGSTVSAIETRIFRARKEFSKKLLPYTK